MFFWLESPRPQVLLGSTVQLKTSGAEGVFPGCDSALRWPAGEAREATRWGPPWKRESGSRGGLDGEEFHFLGWFRTLKLVNFVVFKVIFWDVLTSLVTCRKTEQRPAGRLPLSATSGGTTGEVNLSMWVIHKRGNHLLNGHIIH